MKKCTILANGKPPAKKIISFLMANGYASLYCADGGANAARRMNLVPNFIIGDLDSIRDETLRFYRSKTNVIKISRQNDTDVEKCLKHAIKKGFDEVILTGVTGDRLDHTFCNLGIVLKYFDQLKIQIIAENSLLTALTGVHSINTYPGETISIYGIDDRTQISSKGLKYPLTKIALPFGHKESTSNVSLHDQIELTIKGGIIFLIRDFQMMKKHGLL